MKLMHLCIVSLVLLTSSAHAGLRKATFDSVDHSSEMMMPTRFIGHSDRALTLSNVEKEIFRAIGTVGGGNATLLKDCKTLVTAAHVSQSRTTGRLRSFATHFNPQGDWVNSSRLAPRIIASGENQTGLEYISAFRDWNILELRTPQSDCQGVEVAYVSKDKIHELGGHIYSFYITFPQRGSNRYEMSVQECNLIDDDKMLFPPSTANRKEVLFHDCDTQSGNSGHGLFAKIDGQYYLIGVHVGYSGYRCPYGESFGSEHINAYTCPNQAKWVTGDFARALETRMGRRMKRFE